MNGYLFRSGVMATTISWAAAGGAAGDFLAPEAQITKAVGGCKFTEGPAVDAQGNLFFSDGPNDRIMKRTPDGVVSIFRQPCGATNGMKFDAQGRLVMCQSSGAKGRRRVARLELDGSEISLADSYDGKRLNAPNDLTIDRQGRIYFTDIAAAVGDKPPELSSGVYRIDGPGEVVRVIADLQRPNGIVIAPDNKAIYVSDRGVQKLHRYRVSEDGGLTPDGIVYDFSPDRGIDGMCLDVDGNIVAAAGQGKTTGLFVVSPQGKLLFHQPLPEFATNVAFAGDDFRDLYMTATTSVYHVRTARPGVPPVAKQ